MGSGNTIQETSGSRSPSDSFTLGAGAEEIWHVRENRIGGYVVNTGDPTVPDPPIFLKFVETDGGAPATTSDYTLPLYAGQTFEMPRRLWSGALSVIGTAGTVVISTEIY